MAGKKGVDVISDTTGKSIAEILKIIAAANTAAAKNSIKAIDLSDLGRLARNGTITQLFDYGDTFIDKWKDVAANKEYECSLRLNHVGEIELEDGEKCNAAFLQFQYALPFGVQFSHERAFLTCPDGLIPGTYTIKFAQTWSKLTKLVWNFTLTQSVPAGGKLSGFYAAADNESGYKVYSHTADGKTVIETVTPSEGEAGTVLGTLAYVTRSGNLNSMQESFYGHNRWKTSAIRQFLNSEKGVGEWWTAQDEWDIAPNELTTKAGFLSGCSAELLAAMKPAKVITYANTVNDGGEMDITHDKVYLPSLEEMYFAPQIKGEGEAHKYFMRRSGMTSPMPLYTTYPRMITLKMDNHSPCNVRLRSSNRGGACSAFYVISGGTVYYYAARYSLCCAPTTRIS